MASKEKVSITINSDTKDRIAKIGEQYGLNFSNMVERAVRYYLLELEEEIQDNSEAYQAYIDPDNQERITLSELKAKYKLES
jgi:antitoxin component of RelBE/YafQ-DinJ toxin-antitoxin module